jgi:hypothetical protein
MKRARKAKRQRAAQKHNRPRRAKVQHVAPHTPKQFFKLSKEAQANWNDVTHVISKMRASRMSLTQAAIDIGVDPHIVTRLGKSALRKRKNGQYVAKRADTLLRILTIPTADGLREIVTRDSRQASQLGKYWSAVAKYLQTGDASKLETFSRRRKTIKDASGKKVRLLFDTAKLDELGSAGALSFESLYAESTA